jgi:lipopolysaccharide transport system ATP-binding protein
MKPAVQIEGLSKRYVLGTQSPGGYRTLRETIMSKAAAWRSPRPAAGAAPKEFWALKDVCLDIRPGEVVGLIGRNGAGKSTLLKVLSRITEPTSGRAVVRGRMGSLLEVGTGFHQELTGRENIYLNGSILGMTRREINRKFDEIVAFAEIDQFLDTPVKRYSSGMYVRLAFAVAAHLDLDTLLVDEVLAVGDAEFQKKCMAKMGKVAEGGRTIIFVSHNLGQIHRLCSRAIHLRRGQVVADGPVDDVIPAYLRDNQSQGGRWERPKNAPPPAKQVVLTRAEVIGASGAVTGSVPAGEPFRIVVEYDVLRATPNFDVWLFLRNHEGLPVLSTMDCDSAGWPDKVRPAGRYRSVCTVPRNLLSPTTYAVSFLAQIINQETLDAQHDALSFDVTEAGCIRTKRNDRRAGVVSPIFDWKIESIERG